MFAYAKDQLASRDCLVTSLSDLVPFWTILASRGRLVTSLLNLVPRWTILASRGRLASFLVGFGTILDHSGFAGPPGHSPV